MIVFISGSINSGKSTTSKLIAQKLGAAWLDVDEIAHSIPDFNLKTDLTKVMDRTIEHINLLTKSGKSVVANYVLRSKDYERLRQKLTDKDQHYFTLAPRIEVALSHRGRQLNNWEYQRIKHHYDAGVANPAFGKILDTSDMSLEKVADKIITMIR